MGHEEEARRLAEAVTAALDARNASGQPVRLMAHSMGGVLARTMQLERPQVWARLMQRPGARRLPTRDFLSGFALYAGDRLCTPQTGPA